MKRLCLNAAFNSSPRRVLGMLADEALSFADYYEQKAAQYRIGEPNEFGQYEAADPVEYEVLCEKAGEARDIAMGLERLPATPVILSIAAQMLAEGHCKEVGDFEQYDEMRALAASYNVGPKQ